MSNKMKDFQKYKKYILTVIECLKLHFKMNDTLIDVHVAYGTDNYTEADFKYFSEYDNCRLRFDLERMDLDKLDETIAHEFAHCLTKEMFFFMQLVEMKTDYDKVLDKVSRQCVEKMAMRLEETVL